MAQTKQRKDYRFSPQTLRRLKWLSRRSDRNVTELLETAVNRFFEDEWGKMRSRLVPCPDGRYDLVIGGVVLLTIEEKALGKMGDYVEQLLSKKGGDENLFGVVMLAAGSVPSKVEIHQENIEWFFNPIRDEIEQAMATAEKPIA